MRIEQVLDYVTLVIGSLGGLIVVYGVGIGVVEVVKAKLRSFRTIEETAVAFEKIRFESGFTCYWGWSSLSRRMLSVPSSGPRWRNWGYSVVLWRYVP